MYLKHNKSLETDTRDASRALSLGEELRLFESPSAFAARAVQLNRSADDRLFHEKSAYA